MKDPQQLALKEESLALRGQIQGLETAWILADRSRRLIKGIQDLMADIRGREEPPADPRMLA